MLQGAWDSATKLSAPVQSTPLLKKRRTSSKTTLTKFCMGLQVLWLLQLVQLVERQLCQKKKKKSHTTGAGQAECICGWVTECRFFKRRQWLNGSFLAIDSLVVVRVVQTTLQCFCRAEKERGFQLVDHVDFMKQAMVKHAITTKKQSTLLKTFAPK